MSQRTEQRAFLLDALLARLNLLRGEAGRSPGHQTLEEFVERGHGASRRLAVYGSLAPGQPNHGQVAGLAGTWRPGDVRGTLVPRGWGASLGFPALAWDPAGSAVRVQLLTADALPDQWAHLDAFEGDAYRRILVQVTLEDGGREVANLYAAADAGP